MKVAQAAEAPIAYRQRALEGALATNRENAPSRAGLIAGAEEARGKLAQDRERRATLPKDLAPRRSPLSMPPGASSGPSRPSEPRTRPISWPDTWRCTRIMAPSEGSGS
jgi:hypothetical protein